MLANKAVTRNLFRGWGWKVGAFSPIPSLHFLPSLSALFSPPPNGPSNPAKDFRERYLLPSAGEGGEDICSRPPSGRLQPVYRTERIAPNMHKKAAFYINPHQNFHHFYASPTRGSRKRWGPNPPPHRLLWLRQWDTCVSYRGSGTAEMDVKM